MNQPGELAILNVGDGDTKLTFDKDKPEDCRRAAKIIGEMLRAGYTILVQVGEKDGEPLYQRAKGFDPEHCEYIVAGDVAAVPSGVEVPEEASPPKPRRGRPPGKTTTRIPAETTRAVGVARSAGG